MSTEQCAVIGVGQTHHKKKRADVSIPGLLREAATRALDDAECTWADIDAIVIGKAPDAFEGIVQPELFLADALGGAGKPMLRVRPRRCRPTCIRRLRVRARPPHDTIPGSTRRRGA